MTLRRQLTSQGKPLDSIIMRLCEHCIADRTMESYSDAFHIRRRSKKLLRLQWVQNSGIDNSRTSTMYCMASCLMIPKKQLPLEGKPPNSIIMRSHEHCIADRMTRSSSAAYHKRRHRKYSKKRMMACVKLISWSKAQRLAIPIYRLCLIWYTT